MKIGIILHPYGEKKPAGLGKAILEVTKALIAQSSGDEFVIFLRKKPASPPDFPGRNWRIEILDYKYFWLDRGLKKSEQADVYIFNTPVLPVFFKPKKSVAIIYDFAYRYFRAENLAEFFKKIFLGWYHNFSIKKADKIVAISKTTKKDIIKFSKIDERKIEVVYLGFNKICGLSGQAIEAPEKFFLFVGVIKERKNVLNIVKAFKEFVKSHNDYKLLIAGSGKGKYFEGVKKFTKDEKIEGKVLFLGHVSDNQLCFLYKRAQALIFPSLFEGFGLPVLEAMDCGLPVITSNISSLVELAEDNSALLVNPYDAKEIQAAMGKIVSEDSFRRQLIENGFKQSKKFSWQKTSEQILEIIKHLAG